MKHLHSRREAGHVILGASVGAILIGSEGKAFAAQPERALRTMHIDARPEPLSLDLAQTAVLVIDMQNDFGSKGGMFDQAGIDISLIQTVVPQVKKVLASARASKLPIIYVNMNYRADLSDAGRSDGPNRLKQIVLGKAMTAPDGSRGAILVRDTWNTQVVRELRPQAGDRVVYKTRYSGFANTELHAVLQTANIRNLIVTGCTTSVCVESTVRDAMFLDYTCVLLEDCMAEPQGAANHAATLQILSQRFAWVSDSAKLFAAVAAT